MNEFIQVTQPMFENGFEDDEIQLLVVVNGDVAEAYHGLEASRKGRVDNPQEFEERKIFLQIGGQADFFVGHQM